MIDRPIHQPGTAKGMLAALSKRIDLIRQYANEIDERDFDSKWLGPLRACAEWFSTMPLQPELHAEHGGAFRATVETAYYAMRLSGGQKFAADQPSERRRKLEPQYVYALFLAACCSHLDEPCRHFTFHRSRDDQEWQPAAHGAFGTWLAGDTYRVTRRETVLANERMRTALLAPGVLGADRLVGLDGAVLSDLFGAINPEPTSMGLETLLHKVVRQAVDATITYERKARAAAFAPDTAPVPTTEQLVAGMPERPEVRTPPSAEPSPAEPTPAVAIEAPVVPSPEVAVAGDAPSTEAAPAKRRSSTPRPAAIPMSELGSKRSPKRPEEREATELDAALGKAPNLMKDFFRALAQDIASGKVEVSRLGDRIGLSRRTIDAYGIASGTLITHLQRLEWLAEAEGKEIVLVEAISRLIAPSVAPAPSPAPAQS